MTNCNRQANSYTDTIYIAMYIEYRSPMFAFVYRPFIETKTENKENSLGTVIDLFHRPCLCYQLQSIEGNMYVLL